MRQDGQYNDRGDPVNSLPHSVHFRFTFTFACILFIRHTGQNRAVGLATNSAPQSSQICFIGRFTTCAINATSLSYSCQRFLQFLRQHNHVPISRLLELEKDFLLHFRLARSHGDDDNVVLAVDGSFLP